MLDHGQAPPVAPASPASSATPGGSRNPLFRRKPVEQLVAEGGQGDGGALKRSLTMWQLTMISIGATLGTGIFVVLG
ncbi:amino acid permease, partial [Streptomyces sp. 12297]